MPNKSSDQTGGLRALGRSGVSMVPESPDRAILEVFPNRFPGRPYIVSMSFPEFTSLCPVTGQPDFGLIELYYIPDKLCLESKSFKLYMFSFRNYQSFMETITNTILEDVLAVMQPSWLRVNGLFAPRGATRINVYAEQMKDEGDGAVAWMVANWRVEQGRK